MPDNNNVSTPVVRYLRQLNVQSTAEEQVFDPLTYLGMEQRFVTALPHSGVNNFEEQYVLGINKITESFVDEEGFSIVIKYFCRDIETDSDYYKIVSRIPDGEYCNGYENLFIADENVKFTNATSDFAKFGTGSEPFINEESLYFLDDSVIINDNKIILSPSFIVLREDTLYYIDENKNNIPILVKTTIKDKDEHDDEIIKETIKRFRENI